MFGLYFYKAVVRSVYDGDTVTLDIDLGLGVWLKKQKIRLYGINTPEIRGEERESGLISKHRLSDMILDKEIVIERKLPSDVGYIKKAFIIEKLTKVQKNQE